MNTNCGNLKVVVSYFESKLLLIMIELGLKEEANSVIVLRVRIFVKQ